MLKTTLTVEGMMCGMCEAHVCDTLRKAFPAIQKVKASHSKNSVEFLTEAEISLQDLHKVLDPTGYELTNMQCTTAKKGLTGWH